MTATGDESLQTRPGARPEARAQTLLGGRVVHRQTPGGHRTGIEPVLLAAAIAAKPGARVLEAGTGSGAGLLCLAWRVAGLEGVGIEADPATAALARDNLHANGRAGLRIIEAMLPGLPPDPALAAPFDHAFANPPWHDGASSASPETVRDLARRAPDGLLAAWTGALAPRLRRGGSLTYILPAARHGEALSVLHQAGFGGLSTYPLWPKAGRAARIVLVAGRRGSRAPGRVLPGLVLHEADGGYTGAARAILVEGAPLPQEGPHT